MASSDAEKKETQERAPRPPRPVEVERKLVAAAHRTMENAFRAGAKREARVKCVQDSGLKIRMRGVARRRSS